MGARPLIFAAAMLSCESSTAPDPVVALSIIAPSTNILVGQKIQLAASPLNSSGAVLSGRDVTWATSDQSVATVSAGGLVTAHRPGTARITATSESVQTEITITVAPVPIASITIVPLPGPLAAGTPAVLIATARDSAGSPLDERTLTWTSSDESIVKVMSPGVVTGLKPGTATITATAEGKAGTVQITVIPGAPVSAAILPQVPYMYPGTSLKLALSVKDAAGNLLSAGNAAWTSANPGIIDVSSSGLLQAGANSGIAEITARINGITTSVSARVVKIKSIELGEYHGCSLAETGEAFCWGRNFVGELGIASLRRDTSLVPLRVLDTVRFERISAGGNHTCGLSRSGKAFCWGRSIDGEGGSRFGGWDLRPEPVTGGHTFTEIASGVTHTCAIRSDSEIYCWGFGNFVPARVAAQSRLHALTAGNGFTCGIDDAGSAWCWGMNSGGELGNGTTAFAATPARVAGGLTFSAIDAGGSNACGVAPDQEVWCWGRLRWNNLQSRTVPERVAGMPQVRQVSASDSHMCGITAVGKAWCIGFPGDGEMGDGIRYGFDVTGVFTLTRAVEVAPGFSNLTSLAAVSMGWGSSCGINPDGVPHCWAYWARIGVGNDRVNWTPVMQALPSEPF